MRDPDNEPICGATTRAGTPCRGIPMANGRCRMHGGNARAGIAHPAIRAGSHGRYSKVLPANLLAAYEAAVNDPDLLSVRSELALLQTRIADLASHLGDGAPDLLWPRVQAAWRAVGDARTKRDPAAFASACAQVDFLLAEGAGVAETWKAVTDAAVAFDRLATSERKRLNEMQAMVKAEDAALFASALLSTVTRHVTDPAVLRRIQDDMLSVMHQHRPTA